MGWRSDPFHGVVLVMVDAAPCCMMWRMAKTATVHIKIDPDLFRAIDEARGDVSRTRWIERAIEARLGIEQPQGSREWVVPPAKVQQPPVADNGSAVASEAPRAAPSLADMWR